MKCSSRGETFAFCTVCSVDFSVAGGGVFQVKRHCQSRKHVNRAGELNDHPIIDFIVIRQAHDQITRAELYFATFVAKHNLPFSVADHIPGQ